MEGLKNILAKFPPELPHVLFLWSDNKLNAFTEVNVMQEAYLSPFFYLIMTLTSLKDDNLYTLKRIMFNTLAYKQSKNPPLFPDDLTEELVVYMDNFYEDSPWIFLHETASDFYPKFHTRWPGFQGETCPLITFLSMLTQRLMRKAPFFNVEFFQAEDDIILSPTELEMQKFMLDWLNRDYEDARAEAMEVESPRREEEPSGESLGSEDSDEQDEDSKGKSELE